MITTKIGNSHILNIKSTRSVNRNSDLGKWLMAKMAAFFQTIFNGD